MTEEKILKIHPIAETGKGYVGKVSMRLAYGERVIVYERIHHTMAEAEYALNEYLGRVIKESDSQLPNPGKPKNAGLHNIRVDFNGLQQGLIDSFNNLTQYLNKQDVDRDCVEVDIDALEELVGSLQNSIIFICSLIDPVSNKSLLAGDFTIIQLDL